MYVEGPMTVQETAATRVWRVLAAPVLRKGYLPIGPSPVSLGRAHSNDIVLPSDEVSRRHARIAPAGSFAHAIADLGSSNGTFVNGELLRRPRLLHPGDVISIGHFGLDYLVSEGTPEDLARRFDPQHETSKIALPRGREPDMTGTIANDILLETCQMIELNRHTGDLLVAASGIHGRLEFQDGLIVAGRFGGDTGEKAVREVLALRRGKFSFETGHGGHAHAGEPNLRLRPSALALDLVRARDEAATARVRPAIRLPEGADLWSGI